MVLAIMMPFFASLSCRSAQDSSLNVNSNTDEWVRVNKNRLDGMTRKEFLELPPDLIPAVYRNLSPQVKASVWKDKVDHVLRAKSWSAQQQAELRTLNDMLTPSLFTPDNQKEVERAESWEQAAMGKFETDDLVRITRTLDNFDGTFRDLAFHKASGGIPNEVNVCSCRTPNWLNDDVCTRNSSLLHCIQGGGRCAATNSGCGTLYLAGCNGQCGAG